MDLSGITTALITPFYKGEIDEESFLRLLQAQSQEGIRSFVLASTTGEGPTVQHEELKKLVSLFESFKKQELEAVKKQELEGSKKPQDLKLLLFAGSYSTQQSIEHLKKLEDLSPSALLLVTPYYNKPPQKGLLLHFERIAQATTLPIVLYNVPSRTACSLTATSIGILSQIPNIIGIKEATGDIAFLKEIQQQVPKDFLLLSGDDPSCMEFFQQGGQGAISAGANILAKELIQLLSNPKNKQASLFASFKTRFCRTL